MSSEFVGTFENNQMQKGIFTYEDGSTIDGTFENGKPFSAVFTHLDGSKIFWKNGGEVIDGLQE